MASKQELVYRGDIFIVDLSPVVGSEQGGERPSLVVQNNTGNKFSPTIIVAAISGKLKKPKLPTHIAVPKGKYGLLKDSVVMLEQIRTVDRKRLIHRVGHADADFMKRVDKALKISFDF